MPSLLPSLIRLTLLLVLLGTATGGPTYSLAAKDSSTGTGTNIASGPEHDPHDDSGEPPAGKPLATDAAAQLVARPRSIRPATTKSSFMLSLARLRYPLVGEQRYDDNLALRERTQMRPSSSPEKRRHAVSDDAEKGYDMKKIIGRPPPSSAAEGVTTTPPPLGLTGDVSSKHFPGLFRTSYRQVATLAVGQQAVGDGTITVFDAPSGRKVLMCTAEKTGSTRWKALMYKSKGARYDKPHSIFPRWVLLRAADKRRLAEEPDRSRFMLVRNPYSRLLSGFLDKACHPVGILNPQNRQWRRADTILGHGGPYEETPEEFGRFIASLIKMKRASARRINGHFLPLSNRCGLDAGVQYNFFLRVEDIDTWYADVVELMGLGPHVSSGFDMRGKGGDSDCFHRLTGHTCAQTDAALTQHARSPNRLALSRTVSGSHPDSTDRMVNTEHATGAEGRLREWYNSPEIIRSATLYLRDDLLRFGYPEMPEL